jgi:hypothetical protein
MTPYSHFHTEVRNTQEEKQEGDVAFFFSLEFHTISQRQSMIVLKIVRYPRPKQSSRSLAKSIAKI